MQNIDWSLIIKDLYYVGQIFGAFLIGALVGIQRERIGKAAGIRTYSLVCGGSALFTILALLSFPSDSAARIIAQIVIGIGFLGAGTILHRDDKVSGLTTAAGMWIIAAVGMAIGLGHFFMAFLVAFLIVLVLMFNEEKFIKKNL